MKNYFYIPSDIELWKEKFQKNKSETIKECISEPPFCYDLSVKIKNIVFIEPNEVFQKLSENLPKFAEKFGTDNISFYDTNIRFKIAYDLKISRNIRIVSNFGHLTISIKKNGLELETVAIKEKHQGKGHGTLLMTIMFNLLQETFGDNLPPIYCDCIGSASIGQDYIFNTVSNQCKFFRTFGFRVTKYHKSNHPLKSDHAEMELDMNNFKNYSTKCLDILQERTTFTIHN